MAQPIYIKLRALRKDSLQVGLPQRQVLAIAIKEGTNMRLWHKKLLIL